MTTVCEYGMDLSLKSDDYRFPTHHDSSDYWSRLLGMKVYSQAEDRATLGFADDQVVIDKATDCTSHFHRDSNMQLTLEKSLHTALAADAPACSLMVSGKYVLILFSEGDY